MRLRLTRFDGLHLTLAPNWYELPSHLPVDERRRLLDLLVAATPEARGLVEYSWREFEALKKQLTPSSVVHVSLPQEHEEYARRTGLPPVKPRLGFFTVESPGRWPNVAWDELQVKSKLASWLRRNLRSPEHPLAALDIQSLPINKLSAATCEPIELLILVEMTVAFFGGQQHTRKGRPDWDRCAGWSIGRRLANRLANAAKPLRADLAALIADAPDGELPPLIDRPLLHELMRLGLAHVSEGDALLVPLARLAADPTVTEILAIEGFSDSSDSSFDSFSVEPESADTPAEMGGPRRGPVLLGPTSQRQIQREEGDEKEEPSSFKEFAQADQLSQPDQAAQSTRSIQPVQSSPSVSTASNEQPLPLEPPRQSEQHEGIKKTAASPAPRRTRRESPSSRTRATTHSGSHRVRAQSPRDGVIAFNPRLSIDHKDPWFVDLRPYSRPLRAFTEHLNLLLTDERARVAILQRPRSGASTMVRHILATASTHGIIVVTVGGLRPRLAELHFADILLAALRSVLEWTDDTATFSDSADFEKTDDVTVLPESMLAEIRGWFSEIIPDQPTRDYILSGSDIAENVSVQSLLTIIRRLENIGHEHPITAALRSRSDELLGLLSRIIDVLQGLLASRSSRLCLHFRSLELLDDPKRIDAALLAHSEDLARLPCQLVVNLNLAARYLPAGAPASAAFATATYPEASALAVAEARRRSGRNTETTSAEQDPATETNAVALALLGARADLTEVFDDVGVRVAELAHATGGSAGQLFALAQRACEITSARSDDVVDRTAVEKAINELTTTLRNAVPEGGWHNLAVLADGGRIGKHNSWALRANLLIPHAFLDHHPDDIDRTADDHAGWIVHPQLTASPLFTAAQLTEEASRVLGQGDYSGARERLERALAQYERVLGPEHPDTLGILQNLAITLKAQGDFAGARERYERALAARERLLGPEHPDTLSTLQNLAGTLYAQGSFASARESYERALKAYERLLGPEHPDTLRTLQNLAATLNVQGDFAGARVRYVRALAAYERVLGPEHPSTLITLQNLAANLQASWELSGARMLYERALTALERIRGPKHPDTMVTRYNLYQLLRTTDPGAAAPHLAILQLLRARPNSRLSAAEHSLIKQLSAQLSTDS